MTPIRSVWIAACDWATDICDHHIRSRAGIMLLLVSCIPEKAVHCRVIMCISNARFHAADRQNRAKHVQLTLPTKAPICSSCCPCIQPSSSGLFPEVCVCVCVSNTESFGTRSLKTAAALHTLCLCMRSKCRSNSSPARAGSIGLCRYSVTPSPLARQW